MMQFRLHCPPNLESDAFNHLVLTYVCRNCDKNTKYYAVRIVPDNQCETARATKFGELPPYSPKVPTRLVTLIGRDKDLFHQGQRAEYLGFGVGAFAYYRQVVENQKGRLIADIAKVASREGADVKTLERFSNAAKEYQFKKAVEDIKDVFPKTLMVGEQNPLVALHDALSKGLHTRDDKACLELATAIRLVLTDLAGRMNEFLRDDNEVKQALSTIMKFSQASIEGKSEGTEV